MAVVHGQKMVFKREERGIMCESCGYIYPMDRQEYKEARDKVKKGIDK